MITDSFEDLGREVDCHLRGFNVGIEKEGLRSDLNGFLSTKNHPTRLGHKLTHPYITTDYAETLLELITPVFKNSSELRHFLAEVHKFTLLGMEDELMWPASMPLKLPEDAKIAIADYGEVFAGRMKSVYRMGLGHRYGRSMQAIAGLHYNFSFKSELINFLFSQSDECDFLKFKNQLYFKVIRNFRSTNWMIPLVFGASPCVDESFLVGKNHHLQKLFRDTFGLEYATSLRMGGLGYTSSAQKDLGICYNALETYIATLERGRQESYPDYQKIGVKVDGEYRQLNDHLLQIDNEFYSTLRPKQPAASGESALLALHRRGVEYIEVRLTDLDPWSPIGVAKETMDFYQVYLSYCLIKESPLLSSKRCQEIENNFDLVVKEGRNPKLVLSEGDKKEDVFSKAKRVLTDMIEFSQKYSSFKGHQASLKSLFAKLENPDLLPSQILLNEASKTSFHQYVLELGKKHKSTLLGQNGLDQYQKRLAQVAKTSLEEERKLFAHQTGEFDQYLVDYFNSIKIPAMELTQ